MYGDRRQGCLAGLLELFLLDRLFSWLQFRFGFGRGCAGVGCGLFLLIIFLLIACSIIGGTDWRHLTQAAALYL